MNKENIKKDCRIEKAITLLLKNANLVKETEKKEEAAEEKKPAAKKPAAKKKSAKKTKGAEA